jgi:hypothetical protein
LETFEFVDICSRYNTYHLQKRHVAGATNNIYLLGKNKATIPNLGVSLQHLGFGALQNILSLQQPH